MKYIFILSISTFLLACGSTETDHSEESPNTEATEEANDTEGTPEISEQPEVADEDIDVDCAVDFYCYINDPDPAGITNVRSSPGGEIALELDRNKLEYEEFFLHFVDQDDGWFMLQDKVEGIDQDYSIPGGIGWIHGSVCYVDTRNYGGQELHLYQRPDENSEKVASFKNEEGFHIRTVCGDWVKVYGSIDGKSVEGWIQKEWLCGNPLTTCA